METWGSTTRDLTELRNEAIFVVELQIYAANDEQLLLCESPKQVSHVSFRVKLERKFWCTFYDAVINLRFFAV